MKKCYETGTPWHLGLLEYLCTPLDAKTPFPINIPMLFEMLFVICYVIYVI